MRATEKGEAARRNSRQVMVGGVAVGGGAPVTVQSMLNARAEDLAGNVAQAKELEAAGCQILRVSLPKMRVSLPKMEDVRLIGAIKEAVGIPLVADIHYDYRIALAAVEAGADKIRLNPGNIGGAARVREVASACRRRGVAIRVGVNGGSVEKELLAKHGGPCAEALVESAMNHVSMLENCDFGDIVISLKSSHVPTNVAAYQRLAEMCDYPLHLGVTEAGTYRAGLVKNALGIGALLLRGIGDTLRVSLTDHPVKEVAAGYDILRAAGQPVARPEVISCPTCGRTRIDVAGIAAEVERRLAGLKQPLKVAVMGCVVNGIGEGKEADIGIAGGDGCAALFIKGQKIRTLRGDFVEEFVEEVLSWRRD